MSRIPLGRSELRHRVSVRFRGGCFGRIQFVEKRGGGSGDDTYTTNRNLRVSDLVRIKKCRDEGEKEEYTTSRMYTRKKKARTMG